ncbi:hypothetical protein WJX75_009417 [Coccomyxa subellipsoidea]|uniref:Vacuolar ATPase assembly integral membrane protein VMA21 homolog n=1 Tax=Coccomyxa subellipsoidea TaxID=248742 RepID=A0ABR2Z1R0_9CHLO
MAEVQRGVLEKLIIFSVAIAVIPLCVLYASLYGYCDPIISVIFGRVTEQLRQVVGAILAVLAVNLVLVVYVISAYKEKADKED